MTILKKIPPNKVPNWFIRSSFTNFTCFITIKNNCLILFSTGKFNKIVHEFIPFKYIKSGKYIFYNMFGNLKNIRKNYEKTLTSTFMNQETCHNQGKFLKIFSKIAFIILVIVFYE